MKYIVICAKIHSEEKPLGTPHEERRHRRSWERNTCTLVLSAFPSSRRCFSLWVGLRKKVEKKFSHLVKKLFVREDWQKKEKETAMTTLTNTSIPRRKKSKFLSLWVRCPCIHPHRMEETFCGETAFLPDASLSLSLSSLPLRRREKRIFCAQPLFPSKLRQSAGRRSLYCSMAAPLPYTTTTRSGKKMERGKEGESEGERRLGKFILQDRRKEGCASRLGRGDLVCSKGDSVLYYMYCT